MDVRLRFAPSPTGYLHLGGLRTALFNYLYTKKNGGRFILRIEDTDRTRFVEGAMENLIGTLKWCGLIFDEGPETGGNSGPYIQSQRFETYRKYVDVLLEKGIAYRCFCTQERLDRMREERKAADGNTNYDRKCLGMDPKEVEALLKNNATHVVRLKMPGGMIRFHDMIRGDVEFSGDLIDDQVLLKSDGFPTYHLANVVDDHLMGITHVIRGEEWLSSVPKHIALYQGFDWVPPVFAHLPLILNKDKSKLSKRQGDVAVEDYIAKGFLREAILNYLALLGWNPGNDQEFFTIQELCDEFDIRKVSKSGSVFDLEKLKWMNREYLRKFYASQPDYLKSLIQEELNRRNLGNIVIDKFFALCELVIDKAETVNEIIDSVLEIYLFRPAFTAEQKELLGLDEVREFLLFSREHFKKFGCTPVITAEVMEKGKSEFNLKGKKLFMPIRLAVTGMEHGPDLKLVLSCLGAQETCDRIAQSLTCHT